MADPTSRPPKPKLYKYVSVPRGTTGATIKVGGQTITDPGSSMRGIMKAMNSLGATVNSIAIITESIAKETSRTVATEIRQQSELIKRQEKLRKDKIKRDREKEEKKKKEARRSKDAEAENKSEGLGKFFKSFAKMTTAAVGGFFSGIVKIFEAIFRGMVVYSVLDWMSRPGNVGKLQTVIQGVIGIVKVFKRLIDFGLGNALDGIVKMLDGGFSFKGLFGLFQFIIGSAVLFKTISWIKNPAKLATDFVSVVGFVIKGIMNLKKGVGIYGKVKKFASTRAGRYMAAGATGFAAATGSAIMGGTKEEIVGTGIGAGAGALAGEMLGEHLGGTAGAVAGAAAGSIAGGLLGGAAGKALKPITDAIGKFFKLIGDVLKPVFDFVGNIAKEYFSAVGDLIQSVVNFIEPHKDTLAMIAKVSMVVAFGPLLALMKAITWVIRLFVPKGGDTENGSATSPKRSFGGKVVVPQMASGGTLVGPGPGQEFVDPITQRLKQGLQEAMLLPFRAVGIGLVSAFGVIGTIFGSFMPGPMQALLGSLLGPIASMFGVPSSVFRKVSGFALKGIQKATSVVTEGAGGLLEKLLGGDGDTSVQGILRKILNAVTEMHNTNGQKPQMSIGGSIRGAANGGWINGPMSGYPVSLDGGRSTSFIGHGTEWVGFKNRAAGGGAGSAFVVPFNTPATTRTPSLTSMRMNQARSGGFAMPKFSAGGKFNPDTFNKSMSAMSAGVAVGEDNKKVTFRYAVDGQKILLGHAIDQTNANWDFLDVLGNDGAIETIDPTSKRFKEIVTSTNIAEALANDRNIQSKLGPSMGKKVSQGRSGFYWKIDPKKLAENISVHPQAKTFYDWTVKGKRLAAKFKTEGKSEDEAKKLAWEQSAKEEGVMTAAEKAAESASPQTESKASNIGEALEKAMIGYREAFGGMGDEISSQSDKTKDAQQEAQKAKMKAEAEKVSTAANKLQSKSSAPAASASPPTVVNSSTKPSPDMNPFLKSNFGLISQTAFDPTLVLF